MAKERPLYLIYGAGRGIVVGVDDLRDVLRDRVIADRAVVAHDEAQQAYLQKRNKRIARTNRRFIKDLR